MYNKCELIEKFLVKTLGVSSLIASTDAEKIAHILSEETIEKMKLKYSCK